MATRILFVAPSVYLLGGVQNWLDYILPGLESNFGNEIEATLALTDGDQHPSALYLQNRPWHRVELLQNPTGSAYGRVAAIRKVINKIKPDAVLSVNIADTLEAFVGWRDQDQKRPKLIVTVHGIEGDYIGDLQHYHSVVDGVICTNRLTAALISHYTPLQKDRILYAPYGIDSERPQSKNWHENPPFTEPVNILWLGRFEPLQKRCQELPQIFSHLDQQFQNWKLVLAGDGPVRQKTLSDFTAAQRQKIEYLGVVSHDKILNDILPSVHGLLVNSEWETGPIVIWEAMAAKVSVITSRYTGSGLEASLQHEHNVLMFDIGDTAGASSCILRMIANPLPTLQRIEQGQKLVLSRYTESRSISAWYTAINAIRKLPQKKQTKLLPLKKKYGRLDKVLGVSFADSIRRLIGKKWRHLSPGSEWPHANVGMSKSDQVDFLNYAAKIDRLENTAPD